MIVSKTKRDTILCDSAFVLGKTVTEGTLIIYEERKPCPCCKQGELSTEIGSRVVKIEQYPGTGFAEVGDDMLMYLENGHILRGDSENGFWSIRKVET